MLNLQGVTEANLLSLFLDGLDAAALPPGQVPGDGGIARPETDDDLALFFEQVLGLRFPRTPVCPGHSTPFAAICDAFFARSPVTVWKASRSFGGKTMAAGALAFAEAVCLRASVSLLGGSGDQSDRVHKYLRDFWKLPMAPVVALASDPTQRKTTLVWGNEVVALPASQRAVSGLHPERLRIDECDLVDLRLLDQALGQPMSRGSVKANVVLSSAHYEPDGTFTEVLKRARENGWHLHEWCYKDCMQPHGWLEASEIARQRATVTAEMWRVQYDLQEASAEGRALDGAAVERMFPEPLLPSPRGEVAYVEFEPPVPGATYATGGDWAGRGTDYVSIPTLRDDVRPLRLVAYQRFRRRPAQYILQSFTRQAMRYPGAACHDMTSMGGQFMDDLIDLGPGTALEGVTMTGAARRDLFTAYILAVERSEVRAPRVEALYHAHRFCRNADLWGAGHPPDDVVGMAMAYRAASRAPFALGGTRPIQVVQADRLGSALDFLGGNGHGGNENGDG